MNRFKKRTLLSFTGKCPINCKHCYTYELDTNVNIRDLDEIEIIMNSLKETIDSDIYYISRYRENFIDEKAGLMLTEQIYNTFHKPIFIITRKCLNDQTIEQLNLLNKKMKENHCFLTIAVSISADRSYDIIEDKSSIDSPSKRCQLIKKLNQNNIFTILMARPVLPNRILPVSEIINLIHQNSEYIDSVVASGLAVNNQILKRLNLQESDFSYLPGDNSEYLIGSGAKDIQYINVERELHMIQTSCSDLNLPFFTHSMNALNLLNEKA